MTCIASVRGAPLGVRSDAAGILGVDNSKGDQHGVTMSNCSTMVKDNKNSKQTAIMGLISECLGHNDQGSRRQRFCGDPSNEDRKENDKRL